MTKYRIVKKVSSGGHIYYHPQWLKTKFLFFNLKKPCWKNFYIYDWGVDKKVVMWTSYNKARDFIKEHEKDNIVSTSVVEEFEL